MLYNFLEEPPKESIQYQYSNKLLEFWKFVVDTTIQKFESLNATLLKKLVHQWKEQQDSSFFAKKKRKKDKPLNDNDNDNDNNNNSNTSPSNFGKKEEEEEKENGSVLSSNNNNNSPSSLGCMVAPLLVLPKNDPRNCFNSELTLNWNELFLAMTPDNIISDSQTISSIRSSLESIVGPTLLQIGSDSTAHLTSSESDLTDNQPSFSTIDRK